MTRIRLATLGLTLLGVFALIQVSTASLGEKDHTKTVIKIADAIKKGDMVLAKKLAAAAVKDFEETSDMMHLYRTRSAGGTGFGPTEGNNKAKDGIEKKLQEFEKAIPAKFADEHKNYEAAGYWMAALAEMTAARRPEKDMGAKKVKDWDEWSKDLRQASLAFAKASAMKDAKAVKTASDKISGLCTSCHNVWKK